MLVVRLPSSREVSDGNQLRCISRPRVLVLATGPGFRIGSHGMDFAELIDAEISADPMPLDRERIVLLRRRAAHHDGEKTWISKQRIRFAFGTMATPRTRRDSMPRPFPTHPLTRCTSRRETFRPGKKEMC